MSEKAAKARFCDVGCRFAKWWWQRSNFDGGDGFPWRPEMELWITREMHRGHKPFLVMRGKPQS